MIIEVRQTKANLKQEFKIDYDGELRYTGKQSGYSAYAPFWLYRLDGSERFEGRPKRTGIPSGLINVLMGLFIMFLWIVMPNLPLQILSILLFITALFFIPVKSGVCNVSEEGDKHIARFRHLVNGPLTAYDVIEADDREYRIYNLDRSHYRYLSVYRDDTQIAQINKDLHTVNNRDNYTLYLLDQEAEMADLLTMFILYYDNREFSEPGEVFVGGKKNWSWTYSKTDRFYDKEWLPSHFGWDLVEGPGYSGKK